LIAIRHLRSREVWPVIVVTILCVGSFMLAVIFIVPALAEDTDAGFAKNATMTALLFLAPAAIIQLVSAPLAGRLGARIGFASVLRVGITFSLAVTAALAFFTQQESTVIVLTFLLGVTFMGVALTALSALGVMQSPDEEPGALPGISNASFGIGVSLGFAWAGPILGTGTTASFKNSLWIVVAIGAVALLFSFVLRPKPGATGPAFARAPSH
jgi:predicted MFS family arabinose efflux permease